MNGAAGKKNLYVFAQKPPPLLGQTVYNERFSEYISEYFDVTWRPLGAQARDKIKYALANAWFALRCLPDDAIIYTSPPGQNGLWPFLLLVVAFRLRGLRYYAHHHSFRPINSTVIPMTCMVWLGGALQRHIFLSEGMRNGFLKRYPSVSPSQAICLSNALLFLPEQPLTPLPAAPTLGHLAVQAPEKGLEYAFELFRQLRKTIAPLRLIVAGPVPDTALLARLNAMIDEFPESIEYRGRVDGAQKAAFFQDISALILPTRLIDEAEPLVLYEAMSYGRSVMAAGRGCIPEQVPGPHRLLSMSLPDDVRAVSRLVGDAGASSVEALRWCDELRVNANRQAQFFLARLVDETGVETSA